MKKFIVALLVLFMSIGNVYAVEGEETTGETGTSETVVTEEKKEETTPVEEKKEEETVEEEKKEETVVEEKKETTNTDTSTKSNNSSSSTNTNTKKNSSTKTNTNTTTKETTKTTTETVTETTPVEETVVEEEKEVFNFLKEIKSELVSVKLVEGTYEYRVSVEESVTKLDLQAVALDDTYSVSISAQDLDNTKDDNKITINVSNSEGDSQTYTINVDYLRSYDAELDSSTFEKDNSAKVVWGLLLAFFAFLTGVLTVLHLYSKKNGKRK